MKYYTDDEILKQFVEMPPPVIQCDGPFEMPHDDVQPLEKGGRRIHMLGKKHGIDDVFTDNGYKFLQVILLTGLKTLPGREGNDAIDKHGKEYEIKTTDVSKTTAFSTNHHVNPAILEKYRKAEWIFATYHGINLVNIYHLQPDSLDRYFTRWEDRWGLSQTDINNPKIPVNFVRENGNLIYQPG